jgi:DNA processing protein
MDAETLYSFAFSHVVGIGPMTFLHLVNYAGSAEKAYQLPSTELTTLLPKRAAESLDRFRASANPIDLWDSVSNKGIQYVPIALSKGSESIRSISDPPIGLFIKGNSRLLTQTIAGIGIVGSRKTSAHGRIMSAQLARDLSRAGFCIISGLALGVDGIAHRATLEVSGSTIAVLGCGVDVIYPSEHRQLYADIVSSGGAIVSEFPPGHTVQKGLFVARNRIISGLSKGVVVVEGTNVSGSLITARYAAEQGRDVFAVPGSPTSILSQAPNLLLKEGAIMAGDATDILSYYHLSTKKQPFQQTPQTFTADQISLLTVLSHGPKRLMDLMDEVSDTVPTQVLTVILSELELLSAVERDEEGVYRLSAPFEMASGSEKV